MQIIDLFSGIGGFSLAGQWMGWETILFCDNEPFCHKVLNKHWPEVPIFDDIHKLNIDEIKKGTKWNPSRATIIVGGFP